jgi:DNA-binding MarR family transcriptional regulator
MDAFFTSAEANAWGGFLSAHARLSGRLEENLRRNSGISHAEYEVLLRLFRRDDGRLRINELAAKSVLSHSGTSRLIDRLEGAGLVIRVEAQEDKRGAYAVITEKGREHFKEAARQHTALVREQFLSHFSHQELKTMGSFWERLDEHN